MKIANSNFDKSIVFLNTPINDLSEDILGFKTYVNSICTAIDSKAQMIAVTSPFGAGKSSMAELLEKEVRDKNKKVIKVSMWSQLCNMGKYDDTIELHRNFLYQLVSKIRERNGTYISRRLSKSYGLLKLHAERISDLIFTIIAIVLFILGYVFPHVLHIELPVLFGNADMWNNLFVFGSIICTAIVITSAEVVFSSNKSEGERTIDSNEIVELYQKFVLKYCKRSRKQHIIVIEDLDRTDKNSAVIDFLKELRKYYVQYSHDSKKKNKLPEVVFVVNVKPETSLLQDSQEDGCRVKDNESLYAKLFDYILNIQTINIDDYETVLESILQQRKDYIHELLDCSNEKLTTIPGMQWIIRGKNFGIRDIKDRLNKAFTLYASLKNKFESDDISFEKCSVVAFLTTTYEKDFLVTDDKSFGRLVEANIQGTLTESLCGEELNKCGEDYISIVFDLIVAKHIDSNYRLYYYNYPKNAVILTHEETVLQNAILYNEESEGLNEISKRVVIENHDFVHKTFERIQALKLPLPGIVFKTEPLYIEALRHFPEGVYEWIKNLDYSSNSFEKSCSQLLTILNYDKERAVYSGQHAEQIVKILETSLSEDNLLSFRKLICSGFSGEISLYSSLFMGVHSIITIEELDNLSLEDGIKLINTDKKIFDISYVKYILNRFESLEDPSFALEETVKEFLSISSNAMDDVSMAPVLLQFMERTNRIIDEFEQSIMSLLTSSTLASEAKSELFTQYQRIINAVAELGLSEQTLENIDELERYEGFTEIVAELLRTADYVISSVIVSLVSDKYIDFIDKVVIESIRDNLEWLISESKYFHVLRLAIINRKDIILVSAYKFLFTEETPIMTNEELAILAQYSDDSFVMELIPASLVTENEVDMLTNYFCRKNHSNAIAFSILVYISTFSDNISKKCFYSLNYDTSIKYDSFAAEKRSIIKQVFYNALNLVNNEEKIRFMFVTRYLDAALEKELEPLLKTDKALYKSYIDAVNNCKYKSINKTSVRCICSSGTKYPLRDVVTEVLFENKKYVDYVVSKALHNAEFILDAPERESVLWSTYISIFSSSIYKNTCNYMLNNSEFINRIMKQQDYVGFPEESRMKLSGTYQDSYSVKNVLEYGDEFALKYFCKILGFTDEVAAFTFVELVEDNLKLLESDSLYKHTYEKLVSSGLKAKYTRARRKHGFK